MLLLLFLKWEFTVLLEQAPVQLASLCRNAIYPTTYYIGLLPYLFIDMGTKAEGNTSPTWNLVDPSEAQGQSQEKLFSGSEQIVVQKLDNTGCGGET